LPCQVPHTLCILLQWRHSPPPPNVGGDLQKYKGIYKYLQSSLLCCILNWYTILTQMAPHSASIIAHASSFWTLNFAEQRRCDYLLRWHARTARVVVWVNFLQVLKIWRALREKIALRRGSFETGRPFLKFLNSYFGRQVTNTISLLC